eukprot:COSAG05_NODE_24969_length_198_cov_80.444444_1_plen_20_part_10
MREILLDTAPTTTTTSSSKL